MLNAYSLFLLVAILTPFMALYSKHRPWKTISVEKSWALKAPHFGGGLAVLLTLWVSLTCDFLSFLML